MEIPRSLILEQPIQRAVQKFNHFGLIAPVGTTRDMVLNPDYWMHQRHRINARDEVTVKAADGSFYLHLEFTAVAPMGSAIDPGAFWAKTRIIHELGEPTAVSLGRPPVPVEPQERHPLAVKPKRGRPPKQGPDEDGYTVEFCVAPTHRWRILDRAHVIVEKGFFSKVEAAEWLVQYKMEKAAA